MASKKRIKKNKNAKVIYNKFKKNFKNSIEFKEIKENIDGTLNKIIKQQEQLLNIIAECEKIKEKQMGSDSLENVLEALPIESLKDLYVTEHKLKIKDIFHVRKLEKEAQKILDEQEALSSQSRILHIELLEHRIKALLGNE